MSSAMGREALVERAFVAVGPQVKISALSIRGNFLVGVLDDPRSPKSGWPVLWTDRRELRRRELTDCTSGAGKTPSAEHSRASVGFSWGAQRPRRGRRGILLG